MKRKVASIFGVCLALSLPADLAASQSDTTPPQSEIISAQLAEPTKAADLVVESEEPIASRLPTEHFAGRSSFRSFELSPDGDQLLITRDFVGLAEIAIHDASTRESLKRFRLGQNQSVDWVKWAGNNKILMSVSAPSYFFGLPIRANRLYVRNLETATQFELEVSDEVPWGGDLVYLSDDGAYALISVQRTIRSTPSVYRYELRPGGTVERIVKPKRGFWSWHADNDGVVRLGMGWLNKRLRIYYRANDTEDFDLIGKLKAGDETSRYWSVVQIVSGTDRGYVLEEGESGRIGVRLFDYARGEPIETYYEHPDWDVEELWLNPDGTPLAAIYTDDREQIVWFDEKDRKLHNALKKALGLEELRYISRSDNGERALLWAGSEADPGALYIFTTEAKKLDLLANYRPDLDFRELVKPQPVRYRARDGLIIPSYLTLPRGRKARNLPLIIMPHGGPYGIRDQLSYNDEV